MKVVQLGKFYYPYRGGIETVLKDLCEELKSRVDLHVLVSNTTARTVHEQHEFMVTRVASWGKLFSSSITPSLPHWVTRTSGDIVHVHLPNPLAELSCLMVQDAPLVVHFHSDIVRQKYLLKLYAPFLNRLYDRAACIIAPTPNHITVSPFVSRHRRKCEVVPYGIHLHKFAMTDCIRRKTNALRREKPVLLFTGRLVYYKGLEYLIRSMSELDAELWVIGVGPLERHLKALVPELRLGGKVLFLGEVLEEDLPAYYHAADVVVLPSVANSEMFGVVQLEAFACRKPVVSSALPTGVSWVNQHGVTGLCVPPRNSQALTSAIRRLLENASMRQDMGEAGHSRVEKEFTASIMGQSVFQIYTRLVS